MPKQSIERKISTAERNEELLQKEDSALEDKFGDQVKRERKRSKKEKAQTKGILNIGQHEIQTLEQWIKLTRKRQQQKRTKMTGQQNEKDCRRKVKKSRNNQFG